MRKSPLDTLPERRSLRIYAIDPMLGRSGDLRVTAEIPYRELTRTSRSFFDDRLEVIDFDAATKKYYHIVDLQDARIAMQQGLEPSEADPQFHQQMVYAVASRVLENFDRALGRRLRFWGGQRLRLLPHAFQGRNAYYEHGLDAVLFGYFPASEDDPGANLPGQPVFTCLSHDIVAHEVAHAALDRLHSHYREPTSPQVPALHEAFADIVAIFQRFTFADLVRDAIRSTRGDLLGKPNPLVDIGAQFGAAGGLGGALRSVTKPPDPTAFARTREPHALGLILVAAVFDGFHRTYVRRTADLVRIATGGSGRLPDGELHPDLVNRLAVECGRTAQSVLTMCIRATDYMPPVDPTFSDFLRALVTADFELNRTDELGLRAAMIEAFRVRGIRPEAVGSLAVESLLLESMETARDPVLEGIVRTCLTLGARELSRHNVRAEEEKYHYERSIEKLSLSEESLADQPAPPGIDETSVSANEEPEIEWRELANKLGGWAKQHREQLGLEEGFSIRLDGMHPVHRVAASGELLVEMVAQFVQSKRLDRDLGGLAYRAGVTMVATLDGRIRYLIPKRFHEAREKELLGWVAEFDEARGPAWPHGSKRPQRITEAFSARALDGRRWR